MLFEIVKGMLRLDIKILVKNNTTENPILCVLSLLIVPKSYYIEAPSTSSSSIVARHYLSVFLGNLESTWNLNGVVEILQILQKGITLKEKSAREIQR